MSYPTRTLYTHQGNTDYRRILMSNRGLAILVCMRRSDQWRSLCRGAAVGAKTFLRFQNYRNFFYVLFYYCIITAGWTNIHQEACQQHFWLLFRSGCVDLATFKYRLFVFLLPLHILNTALLSEESCSLAENGYTR